LITLYNAIAGSCAEQEANVGGGGSPPAIVTLNQAYFSDSAVQGAGAGIVPNLFRNTGFINQQGTGPPYPAVSMTGTNITGLSTPVISQVNSSTTKSAYTLPTSTFIAFLNSAQQPVTDPFTGKTSTQLVFFSIGAFLQTPNGITGAIDYYKLDSVSTNIGGIVTFAGGGAIQQGANYPLVDSLAISNTAPMGANNFSQGVVGDWGIQGTGQLTDYDPLNPPPNGQTQALEYLFFFDVRGGIGGNPTVGEKVTIHYEVQIDNLQGVQETSTHTIEITLT